MKNILLCFFIFLNTLDFSYGQISGDTVVCSGYTYNYNVNIPGAVSYNWTLPSGWYGLTGQGTSSISAICNVNIGNLCVEGFDTNSISVGTECINTQWGNGGAGWDIWPSGFYFCPGQSRDVHFMILPDTTGSGSCPPGCGNGAPLPNLIFGLYDSSVPYPQFIDTIDGSWITMPPVIDTYHVYYVDVSAGVNFPDAVEILGGCGGSSNSNTVTSTVASQFPPTFIQSPDPACLGDTVLVTQTNGDLSNISWIVNGGTVVGNPSSEQILVAITSSLVEVLYDGYDQQHFCYLAGGPYSYFVNITPCGNSISGDSVVCAGYSYSYTASIAGAVNYVWTLPSGWYGLTGQGTSSISATCNINEGDICVEGFDINSVSLGTLCITTEWGNGGSQGWDVMPSGVSFCPDESFPTVTPSIISNGTGSGSCPAGCGSGSQHPNILYALYDETIPYKLFVGVVDGTNTIILPYFIATYTVYLVDTTIGANFPDAVIISGGCGGAVINNTITSVIVYPVMPTFSQSPDPACIGDTVLITQTENIQPLNWFPDNGLIFLGSPAQNQALVIIDSSSAQLTYQGYDTGSGCNSSFTYNVNITACLPPTASFTATTNPICPGTCTGFTNLSTGATSYEWLFPSANPNSSTDVNPSNICYNLPGTYDVHLIATNAAGSDTMLLINYITVLPYPPPLSINQLGDTLFSSQGFLSYQWYYNGNAIAGATDYFYVAIQNGDYNLIAVDSNQCEVEAAIFNVITGSYPILSKEIELRLYPNPVKDELTLSFSSIEGIVPIEIFNLLGESALKILPKKISDKYIINVQSLPPGIYILETKNGDHRIRARFVKE